VLLVVGCRRQAPVLLAAIICLTGVLFSLGTPLTIDGHATDLALPFSLLVHVPVLQGVVPIRFSLYEQLGAAGVLGIGLDSMRRGWRPRPAFDAAAGTDCSPPASAGWHLPAWRSITAAAVGVAALIPLIPRYPYPSPPISLPAYFTTGAVDAIPAGSVVLTYPYDIDPDNDPMLWQAETGMRFKILGGQASTPGPHGAATSDVAPLPPPELQQLFRAAMFGDLKGIGAVAPPFDPATFAAIRRFCVQYDIGTVLLQPLGVEALMVARYLTAALGRAPAASGGIDVWYGATADARRLLASKART